MSIIRGHQVQVEGFKMHRWDGPQSFPYVITLFSAPNYCGYYENKAAVLYVQEGGGIKLKQYEDTEPPYRLRGNMDVFTWSLPFLVEKIMSMFTHIVLKLAIVEDENVDMPSMLPGSGEGNPNDLEKRKNVFRRKVAGLAKMHQMFGILRNQREDILKIKNISPDGKLPIGLLMQGEKGIKDHL